MYLPAQGKTEKRMLTTLTLQNNSIDNNPKNNILKNGSITGNDISTASIAD